MLVRFKPQPYRERIVVFRATEDVYYTDRFHRAAKLGWRDVAEGGVEVVDVRGDHLTLLQEPNVDDVARELRERIDRWLEERQRSQPVQLRSRPALAAPQLSLASDDLSGPRLRPERRIEEIARAAISSGPPR